MSTDRDAVVHAEGSVFLFLSGFDLCEVGQEEVVLKTGKQANRRTMHFALQSLLALFGEHLFTLTLLITATKLIISFKGFLFIINTKDKKKISIVLASIVVSIVKYIFYISIIRHYYTDLKKITNIKKKKHIMNSQFSFKQHLLHKINCINGTLFTTHI